MKYISTRGQAPIKDFEGVLLTGLASDGGLYVPEFLPRFSLEDMLQMRGLSYPDLACRIMLPFVADCIDEVAFRDIVHESYAEFAHRSVAPLRQLDRDEWLLELFHGPTLAFKDFALQLLGRLLDHFLTARDQHVAIMGATSGDTGSAAIEGCRHSERVQVFILHPHQRVSEVQRRQMTTQLAVNVHNLAVEGNFDHCQDMVKASFRDQAFLEGLPLVAVNSINWCRIMAQIVYYFYAALQLGAPQRSMAFSVPTGNFGDIYAGYLAREMGLPVARLVIATNQNDILHRFLSANAYSLQPLAHTLSPSMDIVVSSNFERLLFDLHGRDGARVADLMQRMNSESVSIEAYRWERAREIFASQTVSEAEMLACMKDEYLATGEILDPHTAIGVSALRHCCADLAVPCIALATAHPAKFPDAVAASNLGVACPLPAHLADLLEREERFTVVANDLAKVQSFIRQTLNLQV